MAIMLYTNQCQDWMTQSRNERCERLRPALTVLQNLFQKVESIFSNRSLGVQNK